MKKKVALVTLLVSLLALSLTVAVSANDTNRLAGSATTSSQQLFAPEVDVIVDGSFEAGDGSGAWTEASTNFGTPLCTAGFCGTGGGTTGPRTGDWWAWFGGAGASLEVASVAQDVTISSGDIAVLSFYVWNGASSGTGLDDFNVQVDGTMVFQIFEDDPAYTAGYTLVQLDLSAYADGMTHTLLFESTSNGGATSTNFSLDDIVLDVETPTDVSLTALGGNTTASLLPLVFGLIALMAMGALFVMRRREGEGI